MRTGSFGIRAGQFGILDSASSVLDPARNVLDPAGFVSRVRLASYQGMRINAFSVSC